VNSNPDVIDVIVPVFNEEEILPVFFERIGKVALPLNLILVDNASTDGSLDMLRQRRDVTLIAHPRNEGYGGSLIDGIRASTAERLVIIDADCEYPPESIPDLVAGLDAHQVVYASRFLSRQVLEMPLFRRVGNRLISTLFNRLFGQKVTDLYTGFKAMRRSAVADIRLERRGFEHVLELAVRFSQRNITIAEVPIVYELRQAGHSKMNHISETVKFFALLMGYRLAG
jgi:glycosyltransferase involved in cell wall biosynthesis